MSNKVGEENKKSGARRPLVPRLRFSEFRKAEEWDNKPLEACLDYEQPTDYLVSSTNYANTHETPVLTAGKTFILGYTNEKEGVYKDNLPVIIFDDFTTACQFVNFPFKVKSSAMKILHAKNGCSTKFMYELLKMISYEVGAHERHWISKFAPMLVPVPRPKEQQKIADCLSSLDDLITLESQKLNTLKAHKKGLMQQLFPAEGETVPRLRFPEFQEAWVIKTLETIGFFTGGGTPNKENAAYWTGEIPWISSSDLTEDSISQINISRFITKQALQESATKLVPARSILLVSRVGVGKLAVSTFQICTSQDFTNFTPTAADPIFLAYLLKSRKETLLSFNQGTSIKGFTKDNIATLELGFPSSPEQQKIADCLSSLDDLITAQAQKVEVLKTHKKGLMQQLFPPSP